MAQVKVTLNNAAVGKFLKSAKVAAKVNELAAKVAAEIGDGATVDRYTTDRKAAAVKVLAEDQAIEGKLTRAAAALGLEVNQKR